MFKVCTNIAVCQETGMQGFETGKDDSALHSSPENCIRGTAHVRTFLEDTKQETQIPTYGLPT